jgi:hypothetical protein
MLGSLRSEMAVWAEPVIADCLDEAYGDHGISGSWRQLLTIQHRRLWRALILDQRGAVERIATELSDDLHRAGLAPEVTGGIDAVVLDELMDIVFARYRASRDKTKGFGRVLLGAAAQTAAVRPLHA